MKKESYELEWQGFLDPGTIHTIESACKQKRPNTGGPKPVDYVRFEMFSREGGRRNCACMKSVGPRCFQQGNWFVSRFGVQPCWPSHRTALGRRSTMMKSIGENAVAMRAELRDKENELGSKDQEIERLQECISTMWEQARQSRAAFFPFSAPAAACNLGAFL
jgi:hypothetical protein